LYCAIGNSIDAHRIFLLIIRNPRFIHIGCGSDSRFERVDNGLVEWYDLDLPKVIEMRKKFIGDEKERYHLLGYSVFNDAWLGTMSAYRQRPFLFLTEGVVIYCKESQVKSLVLTLHEYYPGAELVFDAFSPFLVRMNNLRMPLTKFVARFYWGLKRGRDLENWSTGICLLDEWSYFDNPEPRLDNVRWMRHVPLFAKVLSIFHYRLSKVQYKTN